MNSEIRCRGIAYGKTTWKKAVPWQTRQGNVPCKKKIILLIQIVNRNLGDAVIADNAEYAIRQALPRLAEQHYVLQRYDIKSKDYELLKLADLIIFGGGGLIKFKQEHFYEYVADILDYAAKYRIPAYFNCVGVEGFDGADERCMRLKQALRHDCVKGISVRDDLDTLLREYIAPASKAYVVRSVDAAIYTPQVYGIKKQGRKGRTPGSRVIGLGIVRHRIFADYGLPMVDRDFQLALWKGTIEILEARGYQWKLFVNGLKSDYDFALEVLEHIGRANEAGRLLAQRPAGSRELVETIASFAGIIACRMHANIIAYALGVPGIGLVWNDKMNFWGARIGYPHRFLDIRADRQNFEPKHIVQCLEDSLAEGVRPCSDAWKASIEKPLQKFIREYGNVCREQGWQTYVRNNAHASWKQDRPGLVKRHAPVSWKQNRTGFRAGHLDVWKQKQRMHAHRPVDWANRLVAAALGGLDTRYAGMNAMQCLEHSLENGFRLLEVDLRMTTDGRLVCVNGWSNNTYEKFGIEPDQYGILGMDYDTFMHCRMFDGHFATMDAAQLFARIKQIDGDWKLILDIGRPKQETLEAMLSRLAELCEGDMDFNGHLLIQLQSRQDVRTVQDAGLPLQVMYYLPPKEKWKGKNITLPSMAAFFKKHGIRWVSMSKELPQALTVAYLKKEGIGICFFTYNTYTEAMRAFGLGIDWVETSFLSVRQLEGYYGKGAYET